MATLEEAARAVKSSLGTKQNKIEWQIATLGDGRGNVDAGNGYVLVRLKENSSTVEIINDGVSLTDGMLVRIEKPAHDPLHWHVVSKNDQRIDEVSTDPPGYNIGPHHRTHEYLGVDQVNADFRQITNLRVYAVSGTFTVGVLVGLIPRSGTNVKVPSQTLDLTSHVPATGARYCLISVDSSGVLVVTDGSIVDGIITLAITDIPATPTGNWRLAAVRLYAGQTAITESVTSNDMVDLRFPEERIAGNPLDVFGVQTANTYFAGPTTGSPALPTFRAGVTDDIASGVFPIARGGTNGSTATQAITNLLPSQAGQAGNVLGTNGTVASWVAPGGGGGGGTIVITSLPIGTIAPFGGSSIPSGWLECNGAAVSRATYADLFAVTGTTYGAGDGSTTFNLPDMRGRTSIGQGTGSGLTPRSAGQTGGEETHVLITAEIPAHTHGIDLYDASSGTPATTKTGSNAGNIATIQSGSAGSGGAHNTMPPFLVTTWIIKYTDTATSAFLYDDAGATISQVTLTASGTGVRIYAARDDHHHQLDQTIAPTMTGAWTFKGHDVNSIGDDQSAAFIHTQYSATKTASFLGQRARGSLASPSAIQANDTITRLIGRGYGATTFGASHRGAVEIVADENWTDSAQGARIDFYTTPTGGTSTAATAHISNAGQFQGPSIALTATSNQLVLQSSGVTGTLTWTPTSTNKTIAFPDGTGTVALKSYVNSGDLIATGIISNTDSIADNFERPDQIGLSTAPTGQVWTITGTGLGHAGITSGRYVCPASFTSYAYFAYAKKNIHIGGKVSFVAGGGTSAAPAAIVASSDASLITNAVHFVFSNTSWAIQKIVSSVFTTLNSGSYSLATDGTVYDVSMTIVNNTVYVELPNGTSISVTDSDVSTHYGTHVLWEIANTASSYEVRWESVFCDPISPTKWAYASQSLSGLAANTVVYADASGNVTTDSTNFKYTAASHQLEVTGIIVAGGSLDVGGAVLAKNAQPYQWKDSGGTYRTVLTLSAANNVDIYNGGGQSIRFINQAGTIANGSISDTGVVSFIGSIASKPVTTAGVKLDPNAATGNFTLSLSPSNLTADRRVTFPNADVTFPFTAAATSLITTTTTAAASTILATDSNSVTQLRGLTLPAAGYSDTLPIKWLIPSSTNRQAFIQSVGSGDFRAALIFGVNVATSDTDAIECMRIASNGYVNFGSAVTVPASPMQATSPTALGSGEKQILTLMHYAGATNDGVRLTFSETLGAATNRSAEIASIRTGAGYHGNLIFRVNAGAAFNNVIDAITIPSTANVLIGTATDGMTANGSIAIAQDLAHRGTKVGFNNVTPIARYSSTGDLRQALIDFGLYTTGGASPLDLNGGLLTAGSAHIGDAATNYSAFAADGTLTMTGTAKVLKEVQVTVMSTRNGASAPTDANRAVGASGNVLLPVKQFSKTTQNDIYFELHPGSDIDSSVNVAIHFMWLPGSGWTSGNYLWNLEYLVKGENAAPYNTGTPTTITANVTPSNATDTIETVFGSTIALTWNQTIWCHFFRDVADTGDDTGDLRFVEMEYTANKLGE